MSLLNEWNNEIELATQKGEATEYVKNYYALEKDAYQKILAKYPQTKYEGSFLNLADLLGFSDKNSIFMGFLEGINNSLLSPLNLEVITEDSYLTLEIDFKKLYYYMYDAKATWLYNLEEWDNILAKDERASIERQYRTEHIAVSKKIGRNDPCICGSGKKYKSCCANK